MLDCLITGDIPSHLRVPIPKGSNWEILQYLWDSVAKQASINFYDKDYKWYIDEYIDGVHSFTMERDRFTNQRNTILDEFGLLGLSTIDLNQKSVILTEGVSDFFSVKLLLPYRNVLGVTTLGGSKNAKALLVNLFDSFLICTDNDSTGLKNASNWKHFLEGYNKQVNIFSPPTGKDITDTFVFNLKLNQ